MGNLLRLLFHPVLRPAMRFIVGMLAIPLFRLLRRRVLRLHTIDPELERDLELWFRGSLLLLVATANMEDALFGWVPLNLQEDHAWIGMGLRLMLAIGVIEAMPDQALFAVIHPGPPKLDWKAGIWRTLWTHRSAILWGCFCKHLNRSSPVFAIMAAIFTGTVGWVCYLLACLQYLIVGLATSRDRALDVLGEFDRQIAVRRQELIEEFHLDEKQPAAGAAAAGTDATEPEMPREAVAKTRTGSVAKRPAPGYLSD